MADEVGIKWIYPPNFEGTFPPGTPSGNRRYSVLLTCLSDGTGEEEAVKMRRTDLLTSYGKIPSRLVVEKIDYDVSGMAVYLGFSGNTDERIAVMNNSSGSYDFTKTGGLADNDPATDNPNDDPEWGNILLSSTSGASDFSDPEELQQPSFGDTYNITLTVRVKE